MLGGILMFLGMVLFLFGLIILLFFGFGLQMMGVNPLVGFWQAGLKFWLTCEPTWFIVGGIALIYFGYRLSVKKSQEDFMSGEKA
ncbi:MAG: hypothetical protein WC528_05210 [Patescibacteria group bacterium]